MKTTKMKCKLRLASISVLTASFFTVSAGALSAGHDVRLWLPPQSGQVLEFEPDRWNSVMRNSEVLQDDGVRTIVRTENGDLYLSAIDRNGVRWVIPICSWFPWICPWDDGEGPVTGPDQ